VNANTSREQLRVDRLRVSYARRTAVHDVSFSVRDGEFLTLLGPSGCGKSTILRTVAGLLEADSGSVRIGETCVSDPAAGILVSPEHRGVGMVFQSYAIWPHMTVRENVAFPLRVRNAPSAEITAAVDEMLAVVGLGEFAERNATNLSGGQQQRIALARALVFRPKLLLLDEPLSNLDHKLRLEMGAEIRRIQTDANVATIYVTHDQAEALMLSDRIAVLKDGRIEHIGVPEAIYERPATPFVSWFVGKTNFLPCTVIAVAEVSNNEQQQMRVRVDGTAYDIDAGGAPDAFSAGDRATLTLRPEDFVVSDGEAGLPVVVRKQHYLGERRQYTALLGEIEIEFHAAKSLSYAAGERVVLRADHGRGVVFGAQAEV
jgi:iron(III) transport system ATP-binding protein